MRVRTVIGKRGQIAQAGKAGDVYSNVPLFGSLFLSFFFREPRVQAKQRM